MQRQVERQLHDEQNPVSDVVLGMQASSTPEERAAPRLDVETLAWALNETDHADCIGWDNPKAGCRGFYRRMARAALAAIEKPL
jgi:hypothetical protein